MTRLRRPATLVVLLFGCAVAGGAAETPADLILVRGRVWTAEASRPWAEAVALRGERIAFVGSSAGAEVFRGPKTAVVDLAGHLVLPGFNEAHIHLMSGALSLERVDLIEDQSVEAGNPFMPA